MVVRTCNPSTQKLSLEDHKFKGILSYLVKPYFKNQDTTQNKMLITVPFLVTSVLWNKDPAEDVLHF
jgi:hypothetical protein